MLDFLTESSKKTGDSIVQRLFQGRPYTKVVPFAVTFTGVAGEFTEIWLPTNAYFEIAHIRIKVDTTAAELTFSDTDPSAVVNLVIAQTTGYEEVTFGISTYRSNISSNPKLLLMDFTGVANVAKGVVFGWEVTRDGYYR